MPEPEREDPKRLYRQEHGSIEEKFLDLPDSSGGVASGGVSADGIIGQLHLDDQPRNPEVSDSDTAEEPHP
jgi:hypothetical protein